MYKKKPEWTNIVCNIVHKIFNFQDFELLILMDALSTYNHAEVVLNVKFTENGGKCRHHMPKLVIEPCVFSLTKCTEEHNVALEDEHFYNYFFSDICSL